MKEIYILFRDMGYYEDRNRTPILAFTNISEAKAYKKALDNWFVLRPTPDFDKMTDEGGVLKPYWKGNLRCPLDPGHLQEGWMETPDYYISTVPFVQKVVKA